MYIKTLAKRSTNAVRRSGGSSVLGMTGLYNPKEQSLTVISCPENEQLEGHTYPVEASRSNINNAATYAKTAQTENQTAIDRMNKASQMARAKEREAAPQMLFYFPSVYFSNGKILVNINPFSCRTPEFEGNDNIRYPVYGYAGVEAFISNLGLDLTTSKTNQGYDMVNYFVCRKHPVIHEGMLNDTRLGEALAAEIIHNPLLDEFKGSLVLKDNSTLYNENAQESVKYQVCLRDHPEVAVYGGVCSMYDFEQHRCYQSPEEILNQIISSICFGLARQDNQDNAELQDFVRNNVYVRCVSGFRLHEAFFDMSLKNNAYTNRRLLAPICERCAYLLPDDPDNEDKENANFTCMPPLKRVSSKDGKSVEEKRHLYTLRSLALRNPTDEKKCVYPKGEGLVVIRGRRQKDSDEFVYYLSLEAGFLTHRANCLTTKFCMEGTKIDLSDQGLQRDKILPLLRENPEAAAKTCQELYNQLLDNNVVPSEPEEVAYPNAQEPDPEALPSEENDEMPF